MTPIAVSERIVSIDVLRGVAVLGILLLNIVSMGLPFAALDDPTIIGNRSAVDFWCWAVLSVLAEGKMRAIFSMLFGAGILLIVQRADARGVGPLAADIHLRRNLWLVLFGAIHSYLLLWPGEILFTYGVAGLPLFALRRLRPRTLLLLGAVVLAAQIPRTVLDNRALAEASAGLESLAAVTRSGGVLTPAQTRSQQRWTETLSGEKPTPAMLQRSIDSRRGGYLANLMASASSSSYVESTYLYQAGLWDALSPMLIGMALLGLGVFSAMRSYRFYIMLMLAGYGLGLSLNIWTVADWTHRGFVPGQRWTSLGDLTRLLVAFGHIAAVMLICKAGTLRWVTAPLAAVGRMALTNYIGQTVICMTIFDGFGAGWFGQLARHQLYGIVAGVWLLQIVASTLWLQRYRLGPLEWLWRSLTYQRRQPLTLSP